MSEYRSIIDNRIKEKQRISNAYAMMVNMLIASSGLLFLILFTVWFIISSESIEIPSVLKWNSLTVLFASIMVELGIKAIRKDDHQVAQKYIVSAAMLGITFSVIQISSWLQMLSLHPLGQNIFLPVTIIHFIHIAIGLILILVVTTKLKTYSVHSKNLNFVKRVALFWHYLTIVWVLVILMA